jgi:O-succinylbenzoic acid--CoA ligase
VVYESFGMTETLSHFAIKNLSNGDLQFTCLEGVNIRTDNNSCLEVFMEGVTDGYIITKDIVSIADNRFEWKGRFDFLINSGGVKIIPEELEQSILRYTNSIKDSNFFLAGISDAVLGQKMILVVEGQEKDLTNVLSYLEKTFGTYKVPKSIHFINEFRWTNSGKIDRLNTLKFIK